MIAVLTLRSVVLGLRDATVLALVAGPNRARRVVQAAAVRGRTGDTLTGRAAGLRSVAE